MDRIVAYLRDGTMPENKNKTKTLRTKSARYTMTTNRLYKPGYRTSLLRCVDRNETDYIFREIHEGIHENHSGSRFLAYKVLR